MPGTWGVTTTDLVTAIQTAADPGLTGTSDSLGYRIAEIERHIHGKERWLGKLAVQTADSCADNNISTPFVAVSGNNAYGTDANDAARVLGTADTPVDAGQVRFDIHRLFISAADNSNPWKLRLIWGTGTMADAITALQYSTVMVVPTTTAGQRRTPVDVMTRRGTCGTTKVWVQAWNGTDNATISFFVGLHEYEG